MSMRKLTSFLLAGFLLIGLMAGCAKTDAPTPPTTTPTDTTAPANPDKEPTQTDSPAAAAPSDDNWLPLVEEPEHISMWNAYTSKIDPNLGIADRESYKLIEQLTNVIVDFTTVSSEAGTEQFSLMLVSGNYTDLIHHDHSAIKTDWPGGLASALDQGILMDVSDLITGGYAPHYQALRESDPDILRNTMLDDGSIPSFHRIMTTKQVSWMGLMLAEDLVEREGFRIDEIKTLHDWHELLTAFAQRDDIRVPFELTKTGMDAQMLTTFNIPTGGGMQSWFRHVGDQVEFNFTSQDYFDYLTTMKQWNDEGILESQWFGTTSAYGFDMGTIAEGDIACFRALGSQISLLNKQSDRKYKAVPSPLREGETGRYVTQCDGCFSRVETDEVAITSSCRNPELCVRWLDVFFAEETFLINNYGIEGLTYEMVDGEPQYTDFMLNNPDGYNWENLIRTYGGKDISAYLYKWDAQVANQSEEVQQAYSKDGFDRYYDEDLYTLPMLSLTPEESERYSAALNNIQTYVQEMAVKFINGTEALTEASYAAYCEKIEKMDVQTCVDILQTAYARFMNR